MRPLILIFATLALLLVPVSADACCRTPIRSTLKVAGKVAAAPVVRVQRRPVLRATRARVVHRVEHVRGWRCCR